MMAQTVVASMAHGTIIEEGSAEEIKFIIKVPSQLPYATIIGLRSSLTNALISIGQKIQTELPITEKQRDLPLKPATRDWRHHILTCDCGFSAGMRGMSRHLRGPCIRAKGIVVPQAQNPVGGQVYTRIIDAIKESVGERDFTTTDVIRWFRNNGLDESELSDDFIRGHVYWLRDTNRLIHKPDTFPHIYRFKSRG